MATRDKDRKNETYRGKGWAVSMSFGMHVDLVK